jgi:hypothetical protein
MANKFFPARFFLSGRIVGQTRAGFHRILKRLGGSNLTRSIQSASFRLSQRIARKPRVCARLVITHRPRERVWGQ